MRALKVPRREGEEVRQILLQKDLLIPGYKIKRDEAFIYFPVRAALLGYDTVECSFEKITHPESLNRFGLKSFDIIGDIAIVDIPENLYPQKEEIARTLLQQKNIHTVLGKISVIRGEFRTRDFEYLGGEKKTETVHTEYGLKYKVDIPHVYFNPRLAAERLRIARMVNPHETVTDMFCGVGPFSILISKLSQPERVYAIDINPRAIELLKVNTAMNRVKNVTSILGDAREEIGKTGHSTRIIMNLPQQSFEFLPEALRHGDIIHYYCITSRVKREVERVKELGEALKIPVRVTECIPVKSYSPDMNMYRIDISTQHQG